MPKCAWLTVTREYLLPVHGMHKQVTTANHPGLTLTGFIKAIHNYKHKFSCLQSMQLLHKAWRHLELGEAKIQPELDTAVA